MAISFTRHQARHLRAVLRRAFGNFRSPGPALAFIADAVGRRARFISSSAAVEYGAASDGHAESLRLPFSLLSDGEGHRKLTAKPFADVLEITLASLRQIRSLGV